MSVRVQIVAEFAKATQLPTATWDRITGTLGNAGYTPKGRPGGGVGAAHYGVSALVSVLLATAAHIPSEAAETVAKLEGLQAVSPSSLNLIGGEQDDRPFLVAPLTTLRSYLEQEVTRWASPTPEMLNGLANEKPWLSAWDLELTPAAPWARLHAFVVGKQPGISFAPPPSLFSLTAPIVSRKSGLTLPVLKIAGDLLADTLAKHAAPLISGMGPFGGTHNPETETAAPGPGKDTSAAALSDQTAGTALGTQQPHNMVEREKSQLPSKSRVCRSHDSHWSDQNVRHRYALAGAAT